MMKKFSVDFESLANMQGHVSAYWYNTEHIFLGGNQTDAEMWCKYFDLRISDYLGQRLNDVLPSYAKSLAETFALENEQVIRSGNAQQFTNILISPQRYKLKLLTLKAPYYDQEGKVAGVFGISHHINEVSLASIKNFKFSGREAECLKLLLKGQTMREMSERLHISLKTVGTYIERLKAKLNCSTRSQLISKALELDLQNNLLNE